MYIIGEVMCNKNKIMLIWFYDHQTKGISIYDIYLYMTHSVYYEKTISYHGKVHNSSRI